ncbi:origin recognition complex subunit 4 [Coniosporium apollinis]|uniref:Origin recognition complex subunit 4 n=1 Tax=Coniosporium apollinis TaxID=61459 RepID=A0ABQ9PAC8_9PEZI|nr:origin recognition complex subunit 4 [Coniosporium apollinis]
MDDSPRLAKRRKLDTPDKPTPSAQSSAHPQTPATGTLKRPTRSSTLRSAGKGSGTRTGRSTLDESNTGAEVASSAILAAHGTQRKARKNLEAEADVYDDIDGALAGDTPSKHPRKRLAGTTNGDEPIAAQTPARRKSTRGKSNAVQANNTPQDSAQDGKDELALARRSGSRGAKLLAEFKLVTGTSPKKIETPSRRNQQAEDSRTVASKEPEAEVVRSQDEADNTPVKRKRTTPSRARTQKSIGAVAEQPSEPAQLSATRKTRGQAKVPEDVEDLSGDEAVQEAPIHNSKGAVGGKLPRRPNRKSSGLDQPVHKAGTMELDRIPATVQQADVSRKRNSRKEHITNAENQGLERRGDSPKPSISRFFGRLLGNDQPRPPQVVRQNATNMRAHLEEHTEDTSQGGDDRDSDRSASPMVSSATSPPSTRAETVPEEIGFVPAASKAQLETSSRTDGASAKLLVTLVMEKLTGKRPIPLVGLDDEYSKVYQLVEQTVNAGEGNSMLLIGSRGSGKSALVNKVLKELSKDNRENFHIIRLNGFIHTDDKLALREVWRQLGREMDLEDDALGKNYADTLSKLLALLSHPSELAGEESDQVAKAVVFVMDEFDLFASHPRQTLLYNLFDIAQSRKAPIAVLGLTSKIDVSESLEKRVKSRFSHRYVHLSVAKNLQIFQEICKSALQIKPEELNIEERAILTQPAKTPQKARGSKEMSASDILIDWNSSISSLFADTSFLSRHLAPHYHLTKSVPSALSTFLLPLAGLSTSSAPTLSPTDFATSSAPEANLAAPDSSITLIPTLPTLALALLIAAARLDIILDTPTTNFNMAYAEYVSLASTARIQSAAGGALATGGVGGRVWGRDVATGEWERLVGCGLLIPVLVGGGVTATSMVRCDVSLEEIGAVEGLEAGMVKWCRQI